MHPFKSQACTGQELAKSRYADGGVTSTPMPSDQKPREPLKVDPEGSLGKALIRNRPAGTYPGIKFER